MSLQQFDFALKSMQARYDADRGARDILMSQLAGKQDQAVRVRDDLATWEQVQILLAKASDYARSQMVGHIEATVTAALTAVFGEGYEFKVALRTMGGQPAADWQVVSQFGETEVAAAPEDARGGGIVDVCSLALRLAMLELLEPKPEGPLMPDEPGKMISREYLPHVAEFLKEYAAATNRQIFLVTHAAALAEVADRAYLVKQVDGISEARRDG